MSPRMKRPVKPASLMSKKPKLYDSGSPSAGSATTMALWPKRSKKIAPGCIVATPIRGAACAVNAQVKAKSSATRARASVRRTVETR